MPADANPNGDIFGGWLPAQMDLAGGSLATQRARGRCATVAVDGMVFHEPVFIGDEVSFYGELIRTGRTSMTVRIEAWRRHLPSDETRKVTEAIFTYVAIGQDRRPRRRQRLSERRQSQPVTAAGSISDGSLFFGSPTRLSTRHVTRSSAG